MDNKPLPVYVSRTCPYCGLRIQPIRKLPLTGDSNHKFAVVSCPSCHGIYAAMSSEIATEESPVTLPASAHVDLPDGMKEKFPTFFNLYKQSTIAKSMGLIDIAGMGYRKALESLVKTYLIEENPELETKILDESLGKSIDRIEYPSIKKLARASSWIGNDQVHLQQKNEGYNIQDMKRFMISLSHLILAELVANGDADSLLNGKKS